jgi:hypothetical protein
MRAGLVHLEPMRRSLEPLERSMVSVRESVDGLEPLLEQANQRIEALREDLSPLGELAEKVPGVG